MAGPYLRPREELGLVVKGAQGATVNWHWDPLVFQVLACGWARHPPLLAGFQGPD